MTLFADEIEEALSESWDFVEYTSLLTDMDDIWSTFDINPEKFELFDFPYGPIALDDAELQDLFSMSLDDNSKIVHHDCMWAGVCGDKYHPNNNHQPTSMGFASSAAIMPDTPSIPPLSIFNNIPSTSASARSPFTSSSGRSLLLSSARAPSVTRTPRSPKKSTNSQQHHSPNRPETPQSLDEDEPPQFKHHIDLATCVTRCSIVATTPSKNSYEECDYYDRLEEERSDSESDGVYNEYVHPAYTNRSTKPYRTQHENTIASDHSYTLSKSSSKQPRLELPGVQTPSDSEEEEEIDVESLGGDKYLPVVRAPDALPTNPSVHDKHQLQRTVASAMTGRTLQQQQQRSGRLPCASSRPRKRPRDRTPQSQQARYRKRKKIAGDPRKSPTDRRAIVNNNNSDSEAENMEKRSLHNDMERQRRISLKKLFDELKNEVPSIREKERAPKVLILREAASLCMKLQREEREREQYSAHQARLLKRVRSLRMDLAARRPNA